MGHLLVDPFGVFIFAMHLLPSNNSISVRNKSNLLATLIFF